MIKKAIENWVNERIHFPNAINESYSEFINETGLDVSLTHFNNIFTNITRIQIIKTGGVYTRSAELIKTIVERAFFGVHMKNVIAIDEKPIIIKNYKQKTVRVSASFKGKMPSNKVKTFNFLEKLQYIYLICAITYDSVFLYHLSNEPINAIKFNAFLHHLCTKVKKGENGKFLLIDNASFHNIEECNKDIMKEKKIAITRTPPMGCIFDPIEEFFASFDFYLKKNLKKYIKQASTPLEQEAFTSIIHRSINDASKIDLEQIFRRSGLLEE